MEGYNDIVDFMKPMEGADFLRCIHIGEIEKMLNFIKIFYSTPGRGDGAVG